MGDTYAKVAFAALTAAPASALEAALNSKAPLVHTHTLASITDAGTAAGKTAGNAVGNVPMIESGGKLNSGILPPLSANAPFVVASQAAMLALSSAVGDVAKRSDLGTSFILAALPASTLGNWVAVTDPISSVTSVNGATGVVTLTTSNVTEGTNLYHTTVRVQTVGDARYALISHTHAQSDVVGLVAALAGKAATTHTHVIGDTSGLQLALDGKVNVGSTEFDARYYTETESDALFASKGNLSGGNEWLQGQTFFVSVTGERTIYQASGGYTGTAWDVKDTGNVSRASATFGGVINAVQFVGGGQSLTGLPAANLSGTVPAGNLPAATAAASGIVELATPAEATTGTDTVRAVTPEGLAASVAATAATKAPIGVLALGTVTTAQAPNVAGKNTVTLTLGAASVTINAPTNPTDGQSVVYEIKQDATGNRAVAWSTGTGGFQFGTDVTATTLSTGAGAIDLVGTRYNAASNKWRIVSFLKGFA